MRTVRRRTAIAGGAVALPLLFAVGAAPSAGADHLPAEVTYQVTELESLAGGASAASSINNRGWVAGDSSLPEQGVLHATLWRNGTATDLGTLGGPNSAVLWPNKNNRGIVVGVAETDDIDPRDEAWSCSAFFGDDTEHACVGFVWERGEMRALPTFGGTHGFATGANNRGQVVGWAETDKEDETCNGRNQALEFIGALWDTRRGDRIQKLPPLPGDFASTGNAINDRGQVVGISGDCDQALGRFSARAAVLWEDGKPIDIGNLGAEAWNTPMAINNRGTVVGFANQEEADGGDFFEEAFRWTEWDGIEPLGMLDGDVRSQALGVNDLGQIVGLSRGQGGDTAVVWQPGGIADLNTLAPGYDGHLVFANDVNDAGVITGMAVSAETGQTVAFVATPTE